MAARIYLITNLLNGRRYVGITRFSIERRWGEHVGRALRGKTKSWLHRSIAKHGPQSFSIVQVASCLDLSTARDVERDVIQSLAPEYNQTCGGEFTVGRRLTPETKARIARSNTGKKRSEETRARQSAAKKRFLAANPEAAHQSIERAQAKMDREKQRNAARKSSAARVWTDASRAKLSASCMGRRYPEAVIERMARAKDKPVECASLNATFDSLSEAADALHLDVSGISKVCRGRLKTTGGLRFQFC